MTPLSPLQIALQEYAYWRKASYAPPKSIDPEAFTDPDFFESVMTGAIGAAANISSRLAGHEFEGMDYETLSAEQITKLLVEIRLAPQMAAALVVIHKFFARMEELDPADPLKALR